MKKFVYLLPICSLLTLASCEKKETPPTPPPPNPSVYYTADAESTLDTSSKKAPEPISQAAPGDQAESYADRPWLKKIRLALSGDQELAKYAKEIHVIIIKGTVQLKGNVPNEEARNQIVQKVKQVVGDRKVEDELEVSSQ